MFEIVYYSNKVKKEIFTFPIGILASYIRIIDVMIKDGPNIPPPRVTPMGNGLYEIRAHGREGIGRAFYCVSIGKKIVILHSFIKKTQKTPRRELDIAIKRLKEVKNAQR